MVIFGKKMDILVEYFGGSSWSPGQVALYFIIHPTHPTPVPKNVRPPTPLPTRLLITLPDRPRGFAGRCRRFQRSEIQPTQFISEDGEWVELFNQMGIMSDISGWRIDGLGYTFSQGTFIEPGEYLAVYKNPPAGEFGQFISSSMR